MIEKIRRTVQRIDPKAMYSPEQITEMGVILDSKLQVSRFKIYALIREGKIESVNLGAGGNPRYYVKGADLKKYVKTVFKI